MTANTKSLQLAGGGGAVAAAQVEQPPRPPVPVRTEVTQRDGVLSIKQHPSGGATTADLSERLKEACGSQSDAWADYLLKQLVTHDALSGEVSAGAFDAGCQFLNGIAPRNELEGALAAQMFAVHHATMSMAYKAVTATHPEMIKMRHDQLNKLSRTFAAQVEALSKLRTGGKQTVEVKYIDARNSQNVIADRVETGGGRHGNGSQPHEPAACPEIIPRLPSAAIVPLWGQEPGGESMPSASDAGQKALPSARRQKPRRSQGAA